MSFSRCTFGIDMERNGSAAAVSLVDSKVSQCKAAVSAFVGGTGEGSLVVDNLAVTNVRETDSCTPEGRPKLTRPGNGSPPESCLPMARRCLPALCPRGRHGSWATSECRTTPPARDGVQRALTKNRSPGGYDAGEMASVPRPAGLLAADGTYFTAKLPQFENYGVENFVNIKSDPDFPVLGDSESTTNRPTTAIFCGF